MEINVKVILLQLVSVLRSVFSLPQGSKQHLVMYVIGNATFTV